MDLINKEIKDTSQNNPNKWISEYSYTYNITVRTNFVLLNDLIAN